VENQSLREKLEVCSSKTIDSISVSQTSRKRQRKGAISRLFRSKKKKNKSTAWEKNLLKMPKKMNNFKDYADIDLKEFRKTAEFVLKQSFRGDDAAKRTLFSSEILCNEPEL